MFHQYDAEVQADRKAEQEKDFLLNFEELKKRAEAGNSSAQYLVGLALHLGYYGCVIDKAEARKWIELARNDENSAGGACAQGWCYELAIGGVIIKNPEKAKECYTKAMEQGYIPAFSELGVILRQEAITTTTSRVGAQTATHTHKDIEKLALAVKLFTAAAEAGYVPAINELAHCYQEGWGLNKDLKEALKLYRIAAEKGCVNAKKNIGIIYEYPDNARSVGLEPSESEARKWYLAAEAQGDNLKEELHRTHPTPKCSIL